MSILALIPIGAAAILAAAGFALRTGPGHHKAPLRERREMPARPPGQPPAVPDSGADAAFERQYKAALAAKLTDDLTQSATWAFRPMITEGSQPWPSPTAGNAPNADTPASSAPANSQSTAPTSTPASAPDHPQDETGPLSVNRERLLDRADRLLAGRVAGPTGQVPLSAARHLGHDGPRAQAVDAAVDSIVMAAVGTDGLPVPA